MKMTYSALAKTRIIKNADFRTRVKNSTKPNNPPENGFFKIPTREFRDFRLIQYFLVYRGFTIRVLDLSLTIYALYYARFGIHGLPGPNGSEVFKFFLVIRPRVSRFLGPDQIGLGPWIPGQIKTHLEVSFVKNKLAFFNLKVATLKWQPERG